MIELPDTCYRRSIKKDGKIIGYHPPQPLRSIGSVIHYISGKYAFPDDPYNEERIIKEILIPHRLSYHILIGRGGQIFQLMPLEYQAFHAGYSMLNGKNGCNAFCFGVALLSTGNSYHGAEPFPDIQVASCAHLHGKWIKTRRVQNTAWIEGHQSVRANWKRAHPGKKVEDKPDPGIYFPWKTFYEWTNMGAK